MILLASLGVGRYLSKLCAFCPTVNDSVRLVCPCRSVNVRLCRTVEYKYSVCLWARMTSFSLVLLGAKKDAEQHQFIPLNIKKCPIVDVR